MLEVPRSPFYWPMIRAAWSLWRADPQATLQAIRFGLRRQKLKDVLKGLWLAQAFQEAGMSLVHVHFAGEAAELAELIRIRTGIPYVVTLHARDLFVPRASLPEVLEGAAGLICISSFNQCWLERRHGADSALKSQVIHLGVPEISADTFPDRMQTERRPWKLLCVARLVEKKGHVHLIEALACLHARGKPCQLTLVGDGPERHRLETLSQRLGLRGQVQFAGALEPSQVLSQYAQGVDVFVLPACVARDGDQDGIPVALMEAMRAGVLVVSTPVSGIPELVEAGVSGFLVPDTSAETQETPATGLPHTGAETGSSPAALALAGTLERALEVLEHEPARAQRMRADAEETIRNRFHGPMQAGKVKALLEKIASSQRSYRI